jgi:hypothetical protein
VRKFVCARFVPSIARAEGIDCRGILPLPQRARQRWGTRHLFLLIRLRADLHHVDERDAP